MILPMIRVALAALRRDRAALALSFVVPVVFFSIFAMVFGGRRDTTPRVSVIVVDEDHSPASQRLVQGLRHEGSLVVELRPEANKNGVQPEYTAATAEAAVKAGTTSVAVIIPHGFGDAPIAFGFGPGQNRPRTKIKLLKDSSDMVAWQMVGGLLQKVAMTSMPNIMAEQGSKYFDQYAGGLTPDQRQRIPKNLEGLRRFQNAPRPNEPGGVSTGTPGTSTSSTGTASGTAADEGLIPVETQDVVGKNKRNPMVSYYAAAVSVMFLLFTSTGSAGSLLDEADNGTLDRVLSTRVNMTRLLLGKLTFNVLLAFSQLVLMFLWAWIAYKVDLPSHVPGFVVMGLSTAFAVGAFGMLLASVCRTRAQLGALSTLSVLTMSAVGGSMFPRFLMPDAMQKAGLLTLNSWAIDGFTKVFWRDEPVSHLWPQVLVLLAAGVVLMAIARKLAQRWEFS